MNQRTFSIIDAIVSLRPGAQWTIMGVDYASLVWLDLDQPKPTLKELEAEVQRLKDDWSATEYQRLRAAEYPPLADLADAVFWQSQGDDTKMTAYIAAVEAIKQKYPKS